MQLQHVELRSVVVLPVLESRRAAAKVSLVLMRKGALLIVVIVACGVEVVRVAKNLRSVMLHF